MAPREMTEEPTVENFKKDLNVTFLKLVLFNYVKYSQGPIFSEETDKNAEEKMTTFNYFFAFLCIFAVGHFVRLCLL